MSWDGLVQDLIIKLRMKWEWIDLETNKIENELGWIGLGSINETYNEMEWIDLGSNKIEN